ncbi:MAG: helix-turn-helix domain-containing protein [Candidatus Sericytochromatia bacterium]
MSAASDSDVRRGILHVGRMVSRYRRDQGWSQQKLAEKLGYRDRNTITQLEQGRRLPSAEDLDALGRLLEIPDERWRVLSHPDYVQTVAFEEALSELLGKTLSLEMLDPISQGMLIQAVAHFVAPRGARMSLMQAHDHFNTLLTFYGERAVTQAFYRRFLGHSQFDSVAHFASRVHAFQQAAIRIYGSFRKAFKTLSVCDEVALNQALQALEPVPDTVYRARQPFSAIRQIPEGRLDDLGYISVERVRKENQERHLLSTLLLELAQWHEEQPHRALPVRKRHRIEALLRKFGSELQLEDTLFRPVDPDEIRREAQRLAPADQELVRIAQTQEQGQQNLAAYLTEPYMDLYIATSMRERADFISVNSFVQTIFGDPRIAPLHLRYFNPTQSWIADRVAKGLVEALMLRRATLTVYMAQKTDTFGKDSEASVALGQGKPVIVYVPRLYAPQQGISSDALMSSQVSETQLLERLQALGVEPETGVDRQGMVSELLKAQLAELDSAQLGAVILDHWADFDLYGEIKTLEPDLRHVASAYLDALTQPGPRPNWPELSEALRPALIDKLVQVALFFERRATTFKEIHPLALQVILSSGVLNGILVVRSAEDCTRMIYQLLTNSLETELKVEPDNYRLLEKHTGSTLRVISKNRLLTNAFWTQYFS